MHNHNLLQDKFREALTSVLPITFIVMVLCFTVSPIPNNMLVSFLTGAAMLIIGMAFFTLGADTAMTPIGNKVGSCITKSKKLWLIVFVSFLLGVIITISEPDLQVLANQVPTVPNLVLIGTVALGVGVFLVIAMLRILFGISLNTLLIVFYAIVFGLAMLVPKNFWAVAFDSGGVTTGPMTVPFIMALGVGFRPYEATGMQAMTASVWLRFARSDRSLRYSCLDYSIRRRERMCLSRFRRCRTRRT